jgi:hypothetical protein
MGKEGLFGSLKKKKSTEVENRTGAFIGTPIHQSFAPSKTPSRTKTPGKKLFQLLWCGSSAQKGLNTASLEEEPSWEGAPYLEGFYRPTSPSQARSVSTAPSSSNLTDSVPSIATDNSIDTHGSGWSSPPPVIRNFLDIENVDIVNGNRNGNNSSTKMKAQDPTSIPLPESPAREQKVMVPAMLSSALRSPDLATDDDDGDCDMFFSPHSNSYEENVHPSSSPPETSRMTMKTPGLGIPTPHHKQDQDNSCAQLFPHPLRAASESPAPLQVRHVALSHSVSEHQEEEDDDEDAFLPDDFNTNNNNNVPKMYTWETVQQHVRQAEHELQNHLEDRHQHTMEDFQEEVEKQLQKHGAQWKQDAEAEYHRLNTLLKEERNKTQQKHMELLCKVTSMGELQDKLDHQGKEKLMLQSQISELEEEKSQLLPMAKSEDSAANEKAKELYRDQLDQQIKELQEELQTLRDVFPESDEVENLTKAKQVSDQKVGELETQIQNLQEQIKRKENTSTPTCIAEKVEVIPESHQEELRQLQASKDEADHQVLELQTRMEGLLQQQVDSSNSMEELIILKAEKAAAERKINELQEQVGSRAETSTAQSKLQEAQAQITVLQHQVQDMYHEQFDTSVFSGVSEVSHEEFFAAKAEVETLRVLRAEEQEVVLHLKAQRCALKKRLDKVEQQLQFQLNVPRKRGRESKVEIGTLTIECLSPPATDDEKDDDGGIVAQLRQDLQTLQAERDALEVQIQQLEQAKSQDIDVAVEQVRKDWDQQMLSLQAELDKSLEDHEAEKKNLKKAEMSLEEIEEFTTQVFELKKQHQEALEAQRRTLLTDMEKALNEKQERIGQLRAEFEEGMVQLGEEHAKEKEVLQAQVDDLRAKHDQEIDLVKAKSKEETDTLQQMLQRLRIEFEDEKIEIIQTTAKEHEEFQAKLSLQQQSYEEELICSGEQMLKLEEQLDQMRNEATNTSASTVTEQYILEMQAKFEEDMDDVKTKSRQDLDVMHTQLEVVLGEMKDQSAKASTLETKVVDLKKKHRTELADAKAQVKEEMEKELLALEDTIKMRELGDGSLTNKIAELQAKTETDRVEYSRRVREVRAEHSKEIDDLLNQLDLVEAEHNERYKQKDILILEKDAVISALGSQLAEAERRSKATKSTQGTMTKQLNRLQRELEEAKAEIASTKQEMDGLVADHKDAMEKELVLRQKLCEEAREEMINRAELQFEQANATYKKLKHEFDQAVSNTAELERELKLSKKKAEDTKKQQEGREVDLDDKLAEARAGTNTIFLCYKNGSYSNQPTRTHLLLLLFLAVATGELNASRKVKQYRGEVDKAQQAESQLRKQLNEAQSTSRSVQSTLAAVVSEKEKLIAENVEMKAVCEELMAMVEGGNAAA